MANYGIWVYAFGYFICYWPYSALTKMLTSTYMPGMAEAQTIGSYEMLPLSAIGAVIGMIVFLTITGWWKHAHQIKLGNFSIPVPTKWTFISGICSTFIIATTTLAYSFEGVSIILVMLMMRGGLLILGPIIDLMRKRKVRWFSFVAFLLSLLSLIIAFILPIMSGKKVSTYMPLACIINVGIYLFAYFLRLNFMSSQAKSENESANIKYFVEEQLTSSPMLVLILAIAALFPSGASEVLQGVKAGFTTIFQNSFWYWVLIVGLFSAGTGVFGGLILLDKNENTYCIPVNRCSSLIAGLLASYTIYFFFHGKQPQSSELWGAAFIIGAVLFLAIPPLFSKKRTPGCGCPEK